MEPYQATATTGKDPPMLHSESPRLNDKPDADTNPSFCFNADPGRPPQNDADLDQDPQYLIVYGMVPGIWLSNKTIHSIRWVCQKRIQHQDASKTQPGT